VIGVHWLAVTVWAAAGIAISPRAEAPDERADPAQPTPGEPEPEEAELEDVSREPDAGPEAVS
jgi:hypothetical protein